MSTIDATTYTSAKTLTPSDTANDGPWAGIWSGAGGTIKVTTEEGDVVTFTNVPAGVVVPVAILRVWATPSPPANVLGLVARPHKGAP